MISPNHKVFFLLLLSFFLVDFQSLYGQVTQSQVDTLFLKSGPKFFLSHQFLVPFSEKIEGTTAGTLPKESYEIAYTQGEVLFNSVETTDSFLLIQYRYFIQTPPKELAIRKFKIVVDTTDQNEAVDVIFDESYGKEPDAFWAQSGGIRKSGSLSRGLTVGNNRGLSVTSGLRLQLEGDLGDGLKIVGAITDENIPVQPDGTTQQISDFDKVFLKLMKGNYSVTIGDYEIRQKGTRFANYYRNVQGLKFDYGDQHTRVSLSGAVARGKFHTNSLMGIDGVSGPYRLTGKNGERFFIVLAGSEKVYLNGKLMSRGESLDYIINYNTAEVTFTSKHVITNISRIVVDFEYNDRYFNRSLLVADLEHSFMKDKMKLRFSYGRDADNPNAPFDDAAAFAAARDTLSKVGDNVSQATTNGVFDLGYNESELRYERADTTIGTQTYERYVFSKNPATAIYGIFFSFVGQGNGFYQRDQSGINNNVFVWVGLDAGGNLRGDYAPVRTWVLPRLLQVMDAQWEYKVAPGVKLYSETAISIDDKNRLSSLGDSDNQGIANKNGLLWERMKLTDSLTMSLDMSYQYIDQKYQSLDRIYQAEYGRIWNIEDNEPRRDEQIGMSKIRFDYKRKLSLEVETGIRNTGPGRQSIRQAYTLSNYLPGLIQGRYTFTHIANMADSAQQQGHWMRHEGDVYAPLGKKWQLGSVIWIEDKKQFQQDSIRGNSFSFIDLKPYIRTNQTQKLDLEASFNYRSDRAIYDGLLRDKSLAYTWFLKSGWKPSNTFSVQTISAYRILNVIDTVFRETGIENSRVLNTNIQSTFSPKNRLIYTNFVYDVSSEQLAQQEVRFIEVNPGQGQYVWLDSLFNKDGIQDISEFQLATNPLVANFVRIVVPTRELFPTTRLSLSGNVRWDFRKVIPKSENGWKEFLRNIRINTNFRINQNKARNTEIGSYFVNLLDPFGDTTLLNANYNLRQDISFFQNNPVGDLKFSYLDNRAQLFLSTGTEFNGFRVYSAQQRLNIGNSKSIEAETRWGDKFIDSEAFPDRNYQINFIETNPKINFQFNRSFRLSTGYQYKYRKNTDEMGATDATVNIHKAIIDAKWNLKDRNNLFSKLELVGLSQNGEPGFSAEYELREGLQPGFNAIWQAFVTVYILSNVELSLTYDGRVSVQTPVIHTGRVQVRAFF